MEITITAQEDSHPENVTEHRYKPDEETNQPSNSQYLEDKMRRKLQFFFMNPIEKWHGKSRFPLKFLVQVIKIVLVSLQLCIFAYDCHSHIKYVSDSKITFSHLFSKGWTSEMEVNAYPPDAGPLAVYRISDFVDALDFSCNRYANLSNALGPYFYYDDKNADPILCIHSYQGILLEIPFFTFNETDRQIIEQCFQITKNNNLKYSTRSVLNQFKDLSAIVKGTVSFSVKTIRRQTNHNAPVRCYRFDISIVFENKNDNGQMTMDIEAKPYELKCPCKINSIHIIQALETTLDIFVIIICSISFVLCCKSIYKAQKLKILTLEFFSKHFDKELSMQGKLEFLDMWYIMIIFNDFLIIVGSVFKVVHVWSYVDNYHLNWCSVFLGTGNMLVWFGVLRYLGFFEIYNIVILTLKNAAPRILRYVVCALLIYAGFTFCGWLILGPYHLKFKTFLKTAECLYLLLNGDDMFTTFYSMPDDSPMIWWYSRIYLYSFISLYIYVILSLFTAVIMDAYDTIKKHYVEGFPKNDLQEFVGSTCFDSGIYREASSASLKALINGNRSVPNYQTINN